MNHLRIVLITLSMLCVGKMINENWRIHLPSNAPPVNNIKTVKFIGFDNYAITDWTLVIKSGQGIKKIESNETDSVQVNTDTYKPTLKVKVIFNKRGAIDKLYNIPAALKDTSLTVGDFVSTRVYKFTNRFN